MATEISQAPLVGVVMGSKSDWETMRHASELLTELGIPHESKVVSAHRTPERLFRYGREAEGRGLEVLIAGAGGAAHLPGMLAAISILPVLGVPVESKVLRGVDSLLSIVQMPRGVPVGTLAIGGSGAANAGDPGGGDPGAEVSGDPRGPCPVPPGSDRRRGRVAGMSESASAIVARRQESRRSVSAGVAGRDRQRPTGPDVHPGGAADGLSRRGAERHGGRARRASGPLDGRRPSGPSARLADVRRPGRGGDRRVRERLGPRAAVAGSPTRGASAAGERSGSARIGSARNAFWPGHDIPHAPWRPVRNVGELDRAVRRPGAAVDPQDGRLGL